MNESYFRDKLSAYLDNELPPDERVIVEQYLAEHPEARTEVERLRKFAAMVDAHAELRDDLYWERSARKIEQRLGIGGEEAAPVAETKKGWSALKWTSAVAAAASVVLVGYIAFKDDGTIQDRVDHQLKGTIEQPREIEKPVPTDTPKVTPPPVDEDARSAPAQTQEMPKPKPQPKQAPLSAPPAAKTNEVDTRAKMAADNEGSTESAQQIITPEVTQPAVQPGIQKEVVPQTTALAESKVDEMQERVSEEADKQVAAFSDIDELTSLRQQRDSLLAPAKLKSMIGITGLTGGSKDRPKFGASAQSQPPDHAKLLDLWYRIAKLTPDAAERKQAVDSLTYYSTGSDTRLRGLATGYLDSLSVRPADSAK